MLSLKFTRIRAHNIHIKQNSVSLFTNMKWLKPLALILILTVATFVLAFTLLGYLDAELTHIDKSKKDEYLKLAVEGTE